MYFYHSCNIINPFYVQSGDGELIWYERQDTQGPKLCDYEKATVEKKSADIIKVLARALGTKVEVKKTRQLFLVDQTRVHVDFVEGLGDFMELEV